MPEKDENMEPLDSKNRQAITFNMKFEDLVKKIAEMEDQEKKEKMDTRRKRAGWDARKLYEIMLMEEIPEDKRPHAPTYAVLDSQLGGSEETGQDTSNLRNHALLHYLANLANSNNSNDTFSFEFVESLVRNGADINCSDINGQTVFHEIARAWNVDVATFLVEQGANVNHQDVFGRSPLHVAAAVDYASMVECILQHGGDIHIKTKGEEQTPIHYAAKNDAVNSLRMLLGHGANINSRDSKNRTPLQVAAEMNSFKAAKLLVTEGAPAGVYDDVGNSAISLLIEKIPEVALLALDQLHTTDYINRREYYFLNHLEGAKLKDELQNTPTRSSLEIAVQNQRFDVIMHPVMRQLIAVKWKIYGKRGAIMDMAFNLLYTILWTIESVTMPKRGHELYAINKQVWWLTLNALIVLLTLMEIKKQVANTFVARRALVRWRESRAEQLQQNRQYCHPRWPQEEQYLNSEIHAVKNLSLVATSNWWIYFDWACLFLILASMVTKTLFFLYDDHYEIQKQSTRTLSTPTGNATSKVYEVSFWKPLNNYTSIAMLLILWFRMFKYAKPFESAGPYVVIFSSVVGDIIKWAVLNTAIVIPFTCAFWIGFGFNSDHPVEGYTDVPSLLNNVFQMMINGKYEWDNLEAANETMARILCGTFILTATIITINLLIALVTNTFEQHYENAITNAVMQRAHTILLLQSEMGKKKLKRYYDYIKFQASPYIIAKKYGRLMANKPEDRANIDRVYDDVRQIKSVLAERFGKRYGKGNKSDIEIVREDLVKVKRSEKELAKEIKNVKLILYGMGGQPVSPVRKSTEGRTSSTELFKDGRGDERTIFSTGVSNNHNNGNSSNNNDNQNNNKTTAMTTNTANSNNNNDNDNNKNDNNNNNNNAGTNNSVDKDTTIIPNQQSGTQGNPLLLAPVLQSYLDTLSLSKSSKQKNRGRRSSKKPASSSTESSESEDDVFQPSPNAMTRDKQKSSRWKGVRDELKKRGSFGKQLKGKSDRDEAWWKGDYDQQSASERSRYERQKYFPSNSERRYTEPQFTSLPFHIPTYPSESIHRQSIIPQIPYMQPVAPQYRSVTPVHQHRAQLPNIHAATMEHFAHGFSTPSEDLNRAFQPYRRISGGPAGQRGTTGHTMMYMPHEMQQNETSSRPSLRRRQPEHGSLIQSGTIPGTMPVQPLPHDEVYYQDERASLPGQEGPRIVQAHHQAASDPGIDLHIVTDDGNQEAMAPAQIQRTIWTRDEDQN